MTQNWNIAGMDSDARENPFHTEVGQEVVSVQESFWARLSREGRFVNKYLTGSDLGTDGTFKYADLVYPSIGTLLYPRKIAVSSNIDTEIAIKIISGTFDYNDFFYVVYAKSGTPLILDFDGDLFIQENNSAKVQIGLKTAAGAKVWGFFQGVEVVPGA